jgi:hypothetical protein
LEATIFIFFLHKLENANAFPQQISIDSINNKKTNLLESII